MGEALVTSAFELVCEIEPPVAADLGVVREQIAILHRSCDGFLVPDSHLGRATVSSIAVAHEVAYLGGRALACLNARDRNLLGLRRDLLTARAYGVEELLFVYGDEPSHGERSGLTVRRMLEEVRAEGGWPSLRVGVAADATRDLPTWKRQADFVCTQVSFDERTVARWRDRVGFEGGVYAGVVALASRGMAERLMDLIPGFEVPATVMRELDRAPEVGARLAVEQVLRLREAGTVDGVHLVPARRYREVAAALQRAGLSARPRG